MYYVVTGRVIPRATATVVWWVVDRPQTKKKMSSPDQRNMSSQDPRNMRFRCQQREV